MQPQIDNNMLAAVWSGDPGKLSLERIPVPVPQRDEALIRVAACGVCHTDLHVMKGEVGFPCPAVLGHEISGTVVRLGPTAQECQGFAVGDQVVGAFIMPCNACPACAAGRDDLCGNFFAQNRLRGTLYDGTSRLHRDDGTPLAMYSMGGLAEYAVVPTSGLAPLPAQLPIDSSAVLGCAAMTAYGAVRRGAELTLGESMVVVAIGGVGSSIIQVGRASGAYPIIAVDVSDDKLEAATRLGAHFTVNARAGDPVAAVRELTGGVGVDVAFEALGRPETFSQAIKMLADGGRMVAVGIADGTTTANVEITPIVRRAQRIIGSYGARTRVDLRAVVQLAARGAFEVEQAVSCRYPLEEASEAYNALDRGEIQGRAIITMNA